MRTAKPTSRLAQMQRWIALVVILTACVAATQLLRAGIPWPVALAVAAAILLGHAWILAVEFALLSRARPGPGVPRPTAWQLLRAWWGEVRIGLLVFGWRQPYRWRHFDDHIDGSSSEGRRRGVLLVHGFVCNRGLWNPWMARLRRMGTPYVAVNLEPVFASIDDYVPIIDQALDRLHRATGQPPLVVAHSMGGLAVRAWQRAALADQRVHGVITIATPHHGTRLAQFAVSPNTRQMRQGSDWLANLAAHESPRQRARFTCFFGHADNIVFPASTATLEGADNRHLPGVAHVHMVYHPAVWSEVCRRLEEPMPAG